MITVQLRETSSVFEIARALITVVRALGAVAEGRVIPTQSITTGVTRIPHGQKGTLPKYAWAVPHADARVFVPTSNGQPMRPDAQFIYLQANTAVTADVFWVP